MTVASLGGKFGHHAWCTDGILVEGGGLSGLASFSIECSHAGSHICACRGRPPAKNTSHPGGDVAPHEIAVTSGLSKHQDCRLIVRATNVRSTSGLDLLWSHDESLVPSMIALGHGTRRVAFSKSRLAPFSGTRFFSKAGWGPFQFPQVRVPVPGYDGFDQCISRLEAAVSVLHCDFSRPVQREGAAAMWEQGVTLARELQLPLLLPASLRGLRMTRSVATGQGTFVRTLWSRERQIVQAEQLIVPIVDSSAASSWAGDSHDVGP